MGITSGRCKDASSPAWSGPAEANTPVRSVNEDRRTPTDPRPGLFLGILLLLAGALLGRTLHGPPPAVGYRINESLGRSALGDPVASYEGLHRVLGRIPDDPHAWFLVGRSLLTLGRTLEAAFYLERASRLDPASDEIRYELAEALAAGGLVTRAEDEIERLLERRPGHADALYLRSALLASRGDADGTIRDLRRALGLSASNPDRFRWDPLFDSVRNDPRFVAATLDARLPGTFQDGGGGSASGGETPPR